jgi:hypothetical protein
MLGMLLAGVATATLLVSLAIAAAGLRLVDTELAVLRARVAKLVRLSVAVDDLRHETTQVVPAYRQAATRATALRRPEDREASR